MPLIEPRAGPGHGGVCGDSASTPPALSGHGPKAEPLPVFQPCPPVVLTAPFLSFSPQTSLMKVPEDACTPVVPTHCPISLHAVWATMTLESRAWDAICSFLLPRSAPIWDTWWLPPLALPPSPSPPAFLQPLLGGAWGFYYTDIVPVPRAEWVREVARFTYRRAQILKGTIRER